MTQVLSDMLIRISGDASGALSALASVNNGVIQINNTVNNINRGGAGRPGGAGGAGGGGGLLSGLFGDFAAINQTWNLAKKAIGMIKSGWEFAEQGAQISSLRTASIKLASSYGTSMSDIVRSVKSASFDTITEYEAMRAANLAMTMGVSTDADKLGQLMQISMLRARAFGLTTEEAFDRITRGIGRRSNKILDDLGFTANATYANEQYAISIGKTAYELTDAERVQAIFTQILKQGNAELKQQGGLAIDASTGFQRADTAIQEFMNGVKEMYQSEIGGFFNTDEENLLMYKEQAGIEVLGGTYKRYLAAYKDYAIQVSKANLLKGQDIKLTDELTLAEYKFAQSIGVRSIQYAEAEMNAWAISGSTTNIIEEQAAAYENLQIATTAQSASVANLTEIQQKFNDEITKTMSDKKIKKPDKDILYGASFKKGEQGIKDWVYQAGIAGLNAEEDGALIRDLGLATNQFTEAEWEAADAMAMLNAAQKSGILVAGEYLDLTKKVSGGLATMMAGGQSDYYIDIWYRIHSSGGGGGRKIGDFSSLFLEPLGGGSSAGGGQSHFPMHGGSFIGMKHGGMIPPGFYTDSYPIRVTSGERVDVTPAGNKNIENTALLSKLDELNFKFDGLPRAIRDAVQTIV